MRQTTHQRSNYSREVEEILTKKPSFFIRHGMAALVLFFLFIIAATALIPYQEQLSVDIAWKAPPDSLTDYTMGTILLSPETAAYIRINDSVTLVWHPPGKEMESNQVGVIRSIASIPGSLYGEALVVFPSRRIPPGREGRVLVETEKSSLLRNMLNPILSLFKYD